MDIRAFIITFNESETIRLTIRHYQKFCSNIFVYDNYSTDDTREICKSLGCKVSFFGTKGVLDDRAYLQVKNHAWKDHRDADYVIVCDADEILYDIPFDPTADIFRAVGYNMYSEVIPSSWDEINMGYKESAYSKAIMFNPRKLKEINYGYGCHGAKPVVYGDPIKTNVDTTSTQLRHMRYIGGVQRIIDRYALYKSRMCDFNIENGFGQQYLSEVESLKNDWESVKKSASIAIIK